MDENESDPTRPNAVSGMDAPPADEAADAAGGGEAESVSPPPLPPGDRLKTLLAALVLAAIVALALSSLETLKETLLGR